MTTYGPYALADLIDAAVLDVLVIDDNFHRLSAGTVSLDTTGTPTTEAFGDSAVRGTATGAAHGDHKHGMPGFGSPVTQAFGDAATDGTSASAAHADHRHGMPTGAESLTRGRKTVNGGDLVGGVYVVPSTISDVFVNVSCTVQLPAPSTTFRPIFITVIIGPALLTAVGGSAVVGGSFDLVSGAILSPVQLVAGDSAEYHSDGSNWRV
jgi:hypothetical protein